MNNLQILIVDDDKISNLEVIRVIKESGITNCVKTALNGGHALLQLSQIYNNLHGSNLLILLDLQMPIMDGFSFLKEFERCDYTFKENIKIAVLVNDDTDQDDMEIARRMGVKEFINKPLCSNLLRKILGREQLVKVA
jgi:CheY-like chemotaxis protein